MKTGPHNRTFLSVILSACLFSATTFETHAQDPATVAIGSVAASAILSQAEQTANRLMEQARETGDYMIFSLAQNMLMLISEARKQAGDLVDETSNKISEQRNALLTQIDHLRQTAESDLEQAYEEADQITANFAQILQDIPGVPDKAEILIARPQVLPPLDVETIFRIIGPNISNSAAVATLPDGKQIILTPETETKAYIKVKPLDYAAQKNESNFIEIKINFISNYCSWYERLWCSDKQEIRSIPVVVPAIIPGKVRLVQKFERTNFEKHSFTITLHHSGKDSAAYLPVPIPSELRAAGWQIDTETIRNSIKGNRLVTSTGGHSGNCDGPEQASIKPDGFSYRVWAGHVNRIVGSDPGDQYCNIAVPIMRSVSVEETTVSDWSDLSWKAAVSLAPLPGGKSVLIEFEYPNGTRKQLKPDEALSPVNITSEANGEFRITPRQIRS